MSHALSLHKIEKLDLSSVPPVRTSAEEDVVLTSVLPTTWPSAAGDDEDQPSKHEDDIATARPSHRRLAGIHSKSLDLEKGHRVEVFVRLRYRLHRSPCFRTFSKLFTFIFIFVKGPCFPKKKSCTARALLLK